MNNARVIRKRNDAKRPSALLDMRFVGDGKGLQVLALSPELRAEALRLSCGYQNPIGQHCELTPRYLPGAKSIREYAKHFLLKERIAIRVLGQKKSGMHPVHTHHGNRGKAILNDDVLELLQIEVINLSQVQAGRMIHRNIAIRKRSCKELTGVLVLLLHLQELGFERRPADRGYVRWHRPQSAPLCALLDGLRTRSVNRFTPDSGGRC